ncbi:hypothetical protein QTL86_19300 [Cellulosilyticum sp. ST5]|uniref:hypothetical protein n=1 Tax=Cellulosilyticum sp. ST5 TaxID=3055805 RepID=UPI003977A456
MIIKALAKISIRQNGEIVTYVNGQELEVSEEDAKRLIVLKVAENLDEANHNGQDNNNGYQDGDGYLSVKELEKMKKQDLVDYANTIGLELDFATKQPDLVHAITDYIEELNDGQL